MTISFRRRTAAASTALLLGLTLAACGDDGDDDTSSDDSDSPAATVPSDTELEAVLLTSDDLPDGFVQGQPDDDEDDETFEGTCISDVGDFEDAFGAEPDSEAETEFTLEDASGQAFVGSKITAYTDAAKVATEFGAFVDTLQECTSVSATNDEGIAFDLQIAYDEAVTVPDAEQQVAISMTGTISAQGQSFDLAYNFVVALTGAFISIVGASEVGDGTAGVLASAGDFAGIQADRLADLVG